MLLVGVCPKRLPWLDYPGFSTQVVDKFVQNLEKPTLILRKYWLLPTLLNL